MVNMEGPIALKHGMNCGTIHASTYLVVGYCHKWQYPNMESIKQALYELVILPLRKSELFSYGKLLCPQKGVLIYGPPGTGKTMLAKAIVRDSGAVFINVRVSNLMSKWFGDAQKLGEYRSHLNCLSCA